MVTSHSEDHGNPHSKNNENAAVLVNDVNSTSLRQALEYCLNILRIRDDSEIYRNTTELIRRKAPLTVIKTYGNWITVMIIIADCIRRVKNDNNDGCYIFSQSQLYDFLALATKVMEREEGKRTGQVNNIILKLMRDIMENYDNFDDTLKSEYPAIIVDIISILHIGIDTKGVKVSSIGIDKYYQSRKLKATTVRATTTSTTVAADLHKDKIMLSSDLSEGLVESLLQITERRRTDLEESLARLPSPDLKRISELCQNYSRLQRYSKMTTEGSGQEFRKEIQRELGRRLEPRQLQRAVESVRRLRTYIENILDNKFTPDASHGINHVKHNLEYGYQLMDLIEHRRQKTR
ncbi:MAG: hypothetical protein WBZ20_12670 [Nitrososphaeraceae archaeon]